LSIQDLDASRLGDIADEELQKVLAEAIHLTQEDRKKNQILFYRPVSPRAQQIHDSAARITAAGGGNGSGKSESVLVDLIMSATGVFPYSQRHLIEQKFRGPIQCRLVVESLTTTLEPIILPKLMWWHWTGVDVQGGDRGHWGWIPQTSLMDGDWQKSYSQKLRILRVLCRDPYHPEKILGESTIQCMSVDQDPSDFASGDFHIVIHDEPPSLPIWRENEARTMRVDGRILLAMTWPDDPAINVDWLYNEVYEPGRSGTDPQIKWLELWTTENTNLKQEAVAAQAQKWSKEISDVRIYGRPIRFSNRIHPEFTDQSKTWCFRCDKSVFAVAKVCPNCGSEEVVEYNHIADFDTSHAWPTVFLIDPHPRKPHAMMWVQVSPSDDWFVVADKQVAGDCVDVKKVCDEIESDMGLFVAQKLTDPNMGASPAGSSRTDGRPVTWQEEFAKAGLRLDLADDSSVGRARINTMLKPDPDTLVPRLVIHPRCKDTIYQMSRYVWDNFSNKVDKDQKQTPKDRYSDFPTLLKYLANAEPNFRFLKTGPSTLTRPGHRRGAY
jgi:hypothetical protein